MRLKNMIMIFYFKNFTEENLDLVCLCYFLSFESLKSHLRDVKVLYGKSVSVSEYPSDNRLSLIHCNKKKSI